MILYHLSTDIEKDGSFSPRAPEDVCMFEDNMTERICVSTSIEGCLTALPGFIKDKLSVNNSVMKLFRIDTKRLCIPDSHILGPNVLLNNHLVPDALLTDEHWILTPIEVPQEDICYVKFNYLDIEKVSLFSAGTTDEIRELYNVNEQIELVHKAEYSSSSQMSPVHEFTVKDKSLFWTLLEAAETLVGRENCLVSREKIIIDFSCNKLGIPVFYSVFAKCQRKMEAA